MSYHIDPEFVELLKFFPFSDFSDPVSSRAQGAEMMASLNVDIDESGVIIENRSIPGGSEAPEIPVRIYRPKSLSSTTAGLVYIHGGGFAMGDLDSEHGGVVSLCVDLGIVIVSVDYRLAPEHPYPAALDDCYSALCWTAKNAEDLSIDKGRIGVCGGSAGGGLSAGLALLTRDKKGPTLCFQCLGIPELDDRLQTVSMQTFTDTPLWNQPSAANSWKYYLGDAYQAGSDNVPCYAAPARATDLGGLPPAYVTTMEFDPLRDEGIDYAFRLLQAGVNVELHSYPGTFHGSGLVNANAAVSVRERKDMRAALSRGLKL